MSVIEAYVTNLGRYNEGHLDGEYLKLPASTKDVQALLKQIGVDGVRYEEVFITDYETEIDGLHDCMGEFESIDELNYLASLLDDMDESDRERFEAVLAYGEYTSSLKGLINLAQNLDCYEFYPGVHDDEDLGRFLIEEMSALEVPEHLENYFDYEAYGRDVCLEEGGVYAKSGFVVEGGGFIEHYDGRDIPEEYRIFAYPPPERSIKATLEKYQRMIAEAPIALDRSRPAPAHDER